VSPVRLSTLEAITVTGTPFSDSTSTSPACTLSLPRDIGTCTDLPDSTWNGSSSTSRPWSSKRRTEPCEALESSFEIATFSR
jgi:hypothetical protein